MSNASMPIVVPWLGGRYTQQDQELVERAILFVQTSSPNLKSEFSSTLPYLEYALDLVRLLAGFEAFHVDSATIAAAIVSYPAERASLSFSVIEEQIDYEVACLVGQVHALHALEWHIWELPSLSIQTELEQKQSAFKREVLRRTYRAALAALDESADVEHESISSHDTGFQKQETRKEFLIRLLLTASPDIRGLIILLADRLCVSTRLVTSSHDHVDVAMFAQMTLDIYAPMADRLGIWSLKSRLETEAFRLLKPDQYNEITLLLAQSASTSEKRLSDIATSIQSLLDSFEIAAMVTAREKHAYSIFRKMQAKNLRIDQVNDILGVRIILLWSADRRDLERTLGELLARRDALYHDRQILVDRRTALLGGHNFKQAENFDGALKDNQSAVGHNRSEIQDIQNAILNDEKAAKVLCYDVLWILTENWPPLSALYEGNAARDWISKPKPNQYQSLHTTLKIEDRLVEVQIRTQAMHRIAEYGVAAAHWRYKSAKAYRRGKVSSEVSAKDAAWSEQLTGIRTTLTEERAASTLQQPRYLRDRIFVITPMGDIVDLRAGASPIDFAYRIHTERGHTYAGARVNGRIARNDYALQNGDIVELLPARGKGPSINWLATSKDDAGKSKPIFARTPQARHKIRIWLRHHGLLNDTPIEPSHRSEPSHKS